MEGGGGEEWNTRATGVQRRGIVTTWQSSLSLSLYLWIPQIFRRSDGQQIWIMYLQNLTWTSSSYQPALKISSSFFLHARGWILSILAFRILEDGFSPLPLFDKLCLNSETSGKMIPRIDPPSSENEIYNRVANFLSSYW